MILPSGFSKQTFTIKSTYFYKNISIKESTSKIATENCNSNGIRHFAKHDRLNFFEGKNGGKKLKKGNAV